MLIRSVGYHRFVVKRKFLRELIIPVGRNYTTLFRFNGSSQISRNFTTEMWKPIELLDSLIFSYSTFSLYSTIISEKRGDKYIFADFLILIIIILL